jgi:hypothetical protein
MRETLRFGLRPWITFQRAAYECGNLILSYHLGFWPQIVRKLTDDELAELEAELAKSKQAPKLKPTSHQIEQMELSLAWPITYLRDDKEISIAVQRVAFYRSIDKDIDYAALRMLGKRT